MNLATTLHDSEGTMLLQARRVLPRIVQVFGHISVAMTESTHTDWVSLLHEFNISIVEGGTWNEGRVGALTDLLNKDPHSTVALFDFDKVLHIFDMYEKEFQGFLEGEFGEATILGRTMKAWSTYPRSWVDTENIANRLANQYFQTTEFDYIVGAWIFSPAASKLIVDQSHNKGFDGAFEYVQIFKKHGIDFGYLEVDWLDWEDPDRNQDDINRLGFEEWKEQRFDSLAEWKKRIQNLSDLVKPLSY